MCGRCSITTAPEAMRRLFQFSGPLPNLRPRYNVAPTQQVPIVRRARSDGERELAQVRWGLMPFWAKDATKGGLIPVSWPGQVVATRAPAQSWNLWGGRG